MSKSALGFTIKELSVDNLQPVVTTFLVMLSTFAITDSQWTKLFPPVASVAGFFISRSIIKLIYKSDQKDFDDVADDALKALEVEIKEKEQRLLSIETDPNHSVRFFSKGLGEDLIYLRKRRDDVRKLKDDNKLSQLKFLSPNYKK